MKPKKTVVMTLECPKCGSLIFSRSRHDYRTCPCGEVSVDGGLDYFRVAFKEKMPRTVKKLVPATKKELFDDWNLRIDKFGIIAPKHENKKRIRK
jgi:hypothetical protein